jgi:hypothetical protein
MVKLGIIAFANNSGLGVQTRRLVEMLNPFRVMVIDATPFSKNKEQDFEWFKPYNHFICTGFPKNHDVVKFIDGLTHVLVCENPYNFYLLHACREKGIKTFVQTNYEFCENLNNPHLPLPDKFLMPSYWMIDDMKKRYGDIVEYLPPPIEATPFTELFNKNTQRKGKKRFLHVVGTLAFKDRNGTVDVLNALKYSKGDFELVITSQHPLPEKYKTSDPRVTFEIGEKKDSIDLYRDFDAIILPRRYGGLCLTLNEALMSGLVPLMPDISPNKELLPPYWLVPAEKKDVIHARELIDVYGVEPSELGKKMDEYAEKDLFPEKVVAYTIGIRQFSADILKPKYEKLWI